MKHLLHLILIFFLLCSACHRTTNRETNVLTDNEPQRIVSTVPSITEVLFELGLGDRVVGVSRFCRYPEEVQKLPNVGGLFDPNDEALLELRPDLVILLAEDTNREERIKSFGIPCLQVEHRSIDGIIDSFAKIGKRCGEQSAKRADELQRNIHKRLDAVAKRTSPLTKPSVMIALHDESNVDMQSVIIAGSNSFFNRAVELAGGRNAAKDLKTAFPTVSREGTIELNPDIVIGIAEKKKNADDTEIFIRGWEHFAPFIPAVKTHRVFLIEEDYAIVPGPRFILFVEQLAEILHPRGGE
jgi:iron complex transport system substrate-binding protein